MVPELKIAFKNVLGMNFATLAREWRADSGLPAANAMPFPPNITPTTSIATPSPEELEEVGRGILYSVATLAACCLLLISVIIVLIIVLTHKKKEKKGSSPILAVG